MSIPNKVIVAGIEYDVVLKDVVIVNGNANMAGACDTANCRIEIWDGGAAQYKQMVLAHEILHALLKASGYDVEEKEEKFVLAMERVFYQFLKDNTNYFNGRVSDDTPSDNNM